VTTEREVRRRAGWIGVEISRSRVRTPGKPGHGLYRVRGSIRVQSPHWAGPAATVTEWVPRPWTGYLFTLDQIDEAVADSTLGPRADAARPGGLHLPGPDGRVVRVPTRWTSAYRGPRGPLPTGQPDTRGARRRAANQQFQTEHQPRRAAGLLARHAAKLRRTTREQR
jgi:hypothetical protein